MKPIKCIKFLDFEDVRRTTIFGSLDIDVILDEDVYNMTRRTNNVLDQGGGEPFGH